MSIDLPVEGMGVNGQVGTWDVYQEWPCPNFREDRGGQDTDIFLTN